MGYLTIVISDIHLGNPYSNWKILEKFLKENPCKNLILNGDIIDEKYLIQNHKELNEEELNFFKWMMNLENTNVVYIIGNHENCFYFTGKEGKIWDKYNVKVYSDYIYITQEYTIQKDEKCLMWGRYYVSHGHDTVFENFVTDSPNILKFIDFSIRTLAKLQKFHKGFIFQKGKFNVTEGVEFEILSNDSRKFLKTGLKIISNFKKKVHRWRHAYNTAGVICGHIHHPEIKYFKTNELESGNFPYMNSGDWLENNSALIQSLEDYNWKIIKIK